MEINAKRGTKVKFLNVGGYSFHLRQARKFMKKGDILTVEKTVIGSWHTDVYFKEYPNEAFNSVMFAEINKRRKV